MVKAHDEMMNMRWFSEYCYLKCPTCNFNVGIPYWITINFYKDGYRKRENNDVNNPYEYWGDVLTYEI